VPLALTAALVVLAGPTPADAAGFTPATQVQTPVASLNQTSVLVGGTEATSAAMAAPAGATVARARLYFASSSDAASATDSAHSSVTLTVNAPTPTVGVVTADLTVDPSAQLITDGGGYRWATDVTGRIGTTTTSVSVSAIDGADKSWALLIIYNVPRASGDPYRQVTYREGFTRVDSTRSEAVDFTGLVPVGPGASAALRVAAAAGGAPGGPDPEGVRFDPDGGGPAMPALVGSPVGNNFQSTAGMVAFSASVAPVPGATAAKVTFTPPPGGDTYFPMVAAYELTFSSSTDLSVVALNGVPATAAVGGAPFTISATVANGGPRGLAANEASVTFTIPANGLAFPGAPPAGCTGTATTVTCPVPPTASGASSTTVGVPVVGTRPAGSRTITATVSTSAVGQDPNASNNSAGQTVGVNVSTDLSVALNGVPATVAVGGSPFTVSATVANAGPSDLAANEASVVVSLPAGLSFSGAPPTGCTGTATTVTCPVPPTAKNGSWTTAGMAVVGSRPAGSRTMTATVSTFAVGQDPNASNNSAGQTVGVSVSTNLSVSPNGVPATVEAGTPFTVTATVANAGPSDLAVNEANVTISLGSGLSLAGAAPAGCSSTATSVSCPAGAIAKNGTWTSPGVGVVGSSSAPGSRTVTVTVATVAAGQDADLTNNSASASVSVEVPNRPPVVSVSTQTLAKDSPPVVVFDARVSASDPDGDVVRLTSITQPAHGVATISADGFTIAYQPNPGYLGPDSLVLNVTDGRGVGTVSATLNINVVGPPPPPPGTSTQQYTLVGSDGVTWQPIDPSRLSVTVNPTGPVTAQLVANADLWTWNAGFNQDLGVFVDGALVGWKESGGSAGTFSPNAATVVVAVPLTAGSHTIDLRWKTNRPDPGGKISAGAGPIGGSYSPTSLTVTLLASPPATAVSTQQYTLTGSDGATWQPMDSTGLRLIVNPAAPVTAQVVANADLWTWNAGFNQDIGVFVDGVLVGWKESGGSAGTFSPNAATMVVPVPLASGPHIIDLRWKTNKPDPGGKISAGAGPIGGAFSPTSLHVTFPVPPPVSAVSTQQYTLTGSDGATWQPMDATNLRMTVNPAGPVTAQVVANADLWTWNAGFNQDIGVFVDGVLVGWKESGGSAGTFSPNAATLIVSVPLAAGPHTIELRWKTNKPDPGGKISAGAGPISGAYSPSVLTTTLLPPG